MSIQFNIEKQNSDDIPTNIIKKLKGLGLNGITISNPKVGPIVTGFPLTIPADIPLNKILSKSEDIALSCGVDLVDIRREGREVIVYVPNKEKKIIDFKDALYWYLNDDKILAAELPLLLGTDTMGNNSFIELTKQPHILISGSTGSGKSIFEANLIASLAMLKSEKELHFYLVDTKRLDLPLFSKLPHVQELARTVEDYYILITMLQAEVERRNRSMEKFQVRNLREYNLQTENYKLPYIILIIDELADLMDKDSWLRKENGKTHVEQKVGDSLRRLIQVCRASGVHVIASTQRTSTDIISGLIKTNFPTRIALKLPTNMDSRVILDESGAENLLGNGDMLIKESDSGILKRYHSPFVRLEDISSIISNIDMVKISMGLED